MIIYYVVLKGHKTGICKTLGELALAVSDYPDPEYKEFDKYEEAQEHYAKSMASRKVPLPPIEPKRFDKEKTLRIGEPIEGSICVSIDPSSVERSTLYSAVDAYSNNVIFERKTNFYHGTINTFIAIVDTFQYMEGTHLRVPVYTTSTYLVDLFNCNDLDRLFGNIQKWHAGFGQFYSRYKWLRDKCREKPHLLEDVLFWHTDEWGEIPSKYNCK